MIEETRVHQMRIFMDSAKFTIQSWVGLRMFRLQREGIKNAIVGGTSKSCNVIKGDEEVVQAVDVSRLRKAKKVNKEEFSSLITGYSLQQVSEGHHLRKEIMHLHCFTEDVIHFYRTLVSVMLIGLSQMLLLD